MAVFMDNSFPEPHFVHETRPFLRMRPPGTSPCPQNMALLWIRCTKLCIYGVSKNLDRYRPSAFCRYLYRTVPNISHFAAFSEPSIINMSEKLPDGSDNAAEHVKKIRKGLLHAGFVVYYNRTVGSEGSHLQGHHHTVVMMRGVFATLEETWLRGLIA